VCPSPLEAGFRGNSFPPQPDDEITQPVGAGEVFVSLSFPRSVERFSSDSLSTFELQVNNPFSHSFFSSVGD